MSMKTMILGSMWVTAQAAYDKMEIVNRGEMFISINI